MSNDIYKILNNFNKLTEQKPQPTEQKAAAKPKTQLQENIEQVNEKYMGFKKTVATKKLSEMDKSQPSSDRGGESSGDPYAKGGKATPVKTKDMAKHAEKALNKAMDKAHKKNVKEEQQDESALQAYLGKKKYGEKGMQALQQAGREGASKEKMAKIRAQHDKLDEQQGVAEAERQLGRFSGAWQILVNGKKVHSFRGNFDQETADRVGVVKATSRGLYNPGSGDKIKIVPVMLDQKQGVAEGYLNEKAVSKAQQKFMGMVHAAQKGGKAASPEVAKVAKGMSKKAARDYASTKHKGLPQHVNETIIKALQEGYTKEEIVQFLLKESDKDYWDDLGKDDSKNANKGYTSRIHKGHYGTEYQGDDDEDDDGQTKKIAKPEGEKRGRGRPKGVKNRVVRPGEKKATAPAGEKRGRGRPPGSKNKMRESWVLENNKIIAEAFAKVVERELGQTYHSGRMPNLPPPVPQDPTYKKDPKTGELVPDVPKSTAKPVAPAARPKQSEPLGTIKGGVWTSEPPKKGEVGVPVPSAIDEENDLPGNQEKIDVAEPKGKIDHKDFAALRAGKKVDERVSIDASPEEIQKYMQWLKSQSQRMSQQAADPAHTPMPGNKLSPVDQYNAIQQDVNKAYMPARGSQLGPQNNLRNDSDAGRYAVPGLGDQGQFFGGMKEEGVAGEAGYTDQMRPASDDFVKQWKNDNEPEVALGAKGLGWGDTPAKAEPAQANLYTPGKTDRTKTKQKPNQYHRFTMKEFDMEEGNEFTGALDAARDAGKKEFEVDGRTYPVKESQLDECGEMGPMANGMGAEQEGKMNVSTNMSSDGNKSVTVTADGEAAVELMQLLALAGMKQPQQAEVYMETAFKPAADTGNAARDAEEQRKRTQAKLKDAEKAGQQGPKAKKDDLKGVKEEKDSRYEANTTPEEEVIPLEVQLKGGDGEVAGKEKEMSPHGSARFSDNPLAVKESMTAKLMREYEGIKVKK